jgi:diguanylate cyclase (GGDEF)-like protein
MQNRTAFTAYEKLMMERITGQCMFIHFDVNCLKKVNDTYGHAAGDRHIIAAANVIQKSFGGKGKCFRVGGDEFFAVLDTDSFNEDYESGLEQFRKLQEEYNASEEPPVKLSIAHGAAVYSYALRNTDAVIKVADGLMYEDKQRMKAAAVSQ